MCSPSVKDALQKIKENSTTLGDRAVDIGHGKLVDLAFPRDLQITPGNSADFLKAQQRSQHLAPLGDGAVDTVDLQRVDLDAIELVVVTDVHRLAAAAALHPDTRTNEAAGAQLTTLTPSEPERHGTATVNLLNLTHEILLVVEVPTPSVRQR